jgi:hypothetical protein
MSRFPRLHGLLGPAGRLLTGSTYAVLGYGALREALVLAGSMIPTTLAGCCSPRLTCGGRSRLRVSQGT